MSADNGIYILKTKDQYRIIHAQAIENIYYTYLNQEIKNIPVSTRLVQYYGNVRYTRDEKKAQEIAFAMAKNWPILEYGIKTISVNKTWKQIVKEARELAKQELEVIKRENKEYQQYMIPILEGIISEK